jgi:hypothetical protein
MQRRVIALYASTFREAREALGAGDDGRLRRLCTEVAGLSGLESRVSLLAMSDAERGTPPRHRAEVLRLYWQATVGTAVPRDAAA